MPLLLVMWHLKMSILMVSIYSKSLKDIFSFEVIWFVLQVTLLSLISSISIIWYFWAELSSFIEGYLSWIPWEWLQSSGATLLTYLLSYMIFLISLSTFTSLLSEKLLLKLAKKHYPNMKAKGNPNTFTSLAITAKSSILSLGLFILFIPLFFIPIVGQILIVYVWAIMLQKPSVYDVGAIFIADKKTLNEKKKKTTLLSMIASLLNYLPILNTFAPVFAQILFLHHILEE